MAPEEWTIRAGGRDDVAAVLAFWQAAAGSPPATDTKRDLERLLVVEPSWRRRGLGSSLVRTGEVRLKRRGAVRLTAIVASDEVAARSLWKSLGYARQADSSRFVRMLSQP